jgi:hypothetical protein
MVTGQIVYALWTICFELGVIIGILVTWPKHRR